jgi:hypothetical protein
MTAQKVRRRELAASVFSWYAFDVIDDKGGHRLLSFLKLEPELFVQVIENRRTCRHAGRGWWIPIQLKIVRPCDTSQIHYRTVGVSRSQIGKIAREVGDRHVGASDVDLTCGARNVGAVALF